jgi:hypothetical protein
MATSRRNKILDAPVNPAIFPGLIMIADTVTTVKTESFTVVFPAKSVLAVVCSSKADTDAEKVVWDASVTNNVATVTFTPSSAGTAAPFSFIILASVTETVPAKSTSSGEVLTPVG